MDESELRELWAIVRQNSESIGKNADAIERLGEYLSIQGDGIAELRTVMSSLSRSRDTTARDLAALTKETRQANAELQTLLTEIREELASDHNS